MDTFDPDYTPTHAHFLLGVKVLLVNPAGKILLLKRSEKVSRPHGWDFPGGGVDVGENPSDAALREIKEETTLDASMLQILSTYLIKTGSKDALIIGYAAKVKHDEVKLVDWEHEDFRWVTLDELKEVKLPKEHVAIVEAYRHLGLDK
ncbi:NUDIX hydrolase [Patescibacteria group bacterium]|nr:NUDIX hydrolase [Patescibacteria group bacterium]